MNANRKIILTSVLAHGLLFALLTPWLTMARGSVPETAEVRTRIVAPAELFPEPPTIPDLLPPPPEEISPAELAVTVRPEEVTAAAPIFDRRVDTSLSTAFEIPTERSIAVRSARHPRRQPAPQVVAAAPPVRTLPVSVPVRRMAGPSRKAMPVTGNPAPKYPARAVERALQGVVLVEAHVDHLGAVVRVEILKGSGYVVLDREALRAVGVWRFRPALRNGVPIASRIEVPIRFRIG